jgi:intein/homing endonuclease
MEVWKHPARFKTIVAGRRWGKTRFSMVWMITKAKKRKQLIWYIAPSYQMAKQIMWQELQDTIPRRWVKRVNETSMTVWLRNGSIISLKGADKPDSLRGVGLHAVVMDEFQDMREETWATVIQPTLASTQGDALFIGCVNGKTKVLPREGFRSIESFSKGSEAKTLDPMRKDFYGLDKIFHEADGFWNNGTVPTRKIRTKWGFELEASHPHPIWVMGKDGRPFWKKTIELRAGDRIAIARGMEVWGNQDPTEGFSERVLKWRRKFQGVRGPTPTTLPYTTMSDDLAYFLGLWVAEGSVEENVGRITITCGDPSIGDFLTSGRVLGLKFKPVSGRSDQWRVNSYELVEFMRHLDMPLCKAPFKKLPSWITNGRREWACAFIAGMWDGDGHVLANGDVRVGYSSASKELASDLQLLMTNLGIIGKVTTHQQPATARAKASVQYRYTLQGQNVSLFRDAVKLRIARKQKALESMNAPDWSRRDGVPNQSELLRTVRNSLRRRFRDKKCHKNVFAGALNHDQDISYRSLEMFVCTHEDSAAPELGDLRKNLEDHYYWDEIVSLEESEAETFDFTIPDTHSFWSNGFISHNTPKSFNHLYKLYMQGQSEEHSDWASWQFKTATSPFIPPQEIERARQTMNEKEFRQEFEASFETMSNRVYHAFDRKVHVGRVKMDPRRDILVGMDFNVDPMSAVFFQVIDGQVRVFGESVINNSSTMEMTDELERLFWRHKSRVVIYPDPAGAQRSTAASAGQSDFAILRSQGFKRLKYRRKHPPRRDRINSMNRIMRSGDGTSRLLIDSSCKKLIESLEQTQYKPGTSEVDKRMHLEHATDALGYGVELEFPVRDIQILGASI